MGHLSGHQAGLIGKVRRDRDRVDEGNAAVSRTKLDDIRDLAGFGYRQELDRSLGSFSSFAAGFSYISILTGVFQMFSLGFAAAGPAFFWTWPVVFLGQLTVGLGFAELAAHYPLSGGVYQWSRRIGSPALGWMAGWVYLASSLLSLAAVALALQATLPQISPVFQLIGDAGEPGRPGEERRVPGLRPDRFDHGDQRGRRAAAGADQQRRGVRGATRGGAARSSCCSRGPARAFDLVSNPDRGPCRFRSWLCRLAVGDVRRGGDARVRALRV